MKTKAKINNLASDMTGKLSELIGYVQGGIQTNPQGGWFLEELSAKLKELRSESTEIKNLTDENSASAVHAAGFRPQPLTRGLTREQCRNRTVKLNWKKGAIC